MEHLPPWLRNVPLPPRPTSGAGAPATWLDAPDAAPAAAAGDDMPDWLRDLQSEVADERPSAGQRPPAPPSREPAGEDVPDWLRALESEPPPPPATPGERPTPFGATSWLATLGQGDAAPPRPADELPPEPPTTTTSRIRMPVGATDWLRSIGQESDVEEEIARAERERTAPAEEDKADIPDWLRDVTAEELAAEEAARSPEPEPAIDPRQPDWQGGQAPPERGGLNLDAAPLDETVSSTDDVPDWLRDIVPADQMPPAGGRKPAGPPSWLAGEDGDAGAGEDDGPDWLRQFTGEAPARPAPGRAPADADDVPSWLRETEDLPAGRVADVPDEPAADDVPAWLREADEPPAREAVTGGAADDVPAWLRGADEPPAREPVAGAADDVPAWLREADEPPAREAVAGGAADDVPSWLREADEPPAREPVAGGAADDVPAWLREADEPPAGPGQGAAAANLQPPPPPVADDVPAWLQELEPGSREAADPQPVRAESDAPAPPAWLRDEREEPAAPATPEWLREPEGRDPPPPPGDLPPWLSADPAPAPAAPGPGELSLPSWLRGVSEEPAAPEPGSTPRPPRPAEEPPRRAAPSSRSRPADSEGDDFLRGADLPSWLRPSEPERAADSAEAQTFDWLTRLGASEQEEENEARAPVAAAPAPPRVRYQRSAEQVAAVSLLSQLVRAPYPEVAPAPAVAPPSRWQRIGLDRVLYLLFALTLLAGLLVPQISAPLQTGAPTAPGAAELSSVLGGLTSDDVVLVGYEWGAQRSAELRPLERAVMGQLAANKVKLILVSTDLQGALLAFDQREPLRAAGYNVEPNGQVFGARDYVLLGYRPGGELALRSIARDLRGELRSDFAGRDATEGLLASNIQSIKDVAMILVMADQPQDVQAWMEQVRPAVPGTPIAFLLPQEAQPLVQPYLALENVYHLAGLQGALAFSTGSAGADQAAIARSAGQLSLAVVVFVVLLLVGAVGAAITRVRRRRGETA